MTKNVERKTIALPKERELPISDGRGHFLPVLQIFGRLMAIMLYPEKEYQPNRLAMSLENIQLLFEAASGVTGPNAEAALGSVMTDLVGRELPAAWVEASGDRLPKGLDAGRILFTLRFFAQNAPEFASVKRVKKFLMFCRVNTTEKSGPSLNIGALAAD